MRGSDNQNPDPVYLYNLYNDIADNMRSQAASLIKVERAIAEQTIIIRTYDQKHTEHDRRLERHDDRLRKVERRQDSCGADAQIRGMWHHIKKLSAFKDMIQSRANEDSNVIDLHALRMQEAATSDASAWRKTAFKWVPWLLVAFVTGIALATVLVVKVVSAETVLPDLPKMDVKTDVK